MGVGGGPARRLLPDGVEPRRWIVRVRPGRYHVARGGERETPDGPLSVAMDHYRRHEGDVRLADVPVWEGGRGCRLADLVAEGGFATGPAGEAP